MIIGINLISLGTNKPTGAFRYIQLILQELSSYNLEDCYFYVYKQKHIPASLLGIPEELNVEFINVPSVGMGIKRVLFEQTIFYLYLKKCDVFYSYCTSMPLCLTAKKIFTLHDVYFITNKECYPVILRLYRRLITKIYILSVDKILTVSEFSKNQICKYYNVSKDKVIVTYNFVKSDSVPVSTEKVEVKDIYNNTVNLSLPFFLYVGNIQPSKNIEGMVAAFNKFNIEQKYNMLIVGKPTFSGEKIISIIRNIPNVYILGYQSRNVVEYLLSKALAIVLLSFCEGFGIPPLEGFQYGKPALVSDNSSLPEVVGRAGVKVSPYDIDSIVDGYSELISSYDELVKHIPDQLAKFSPSQSTERFMNALGINWRI